MELPKLKKPIEEYNPHYLKHREKIYKKALEVQKQKTEEKRKKRAIEYLTKVLNINISN